MITKKNLWLTLILLSVALTASAGDLIGSEPLKLTVPQMEPKLVYPIETKEIKPVLSLRTMPSSTTSDKKPYWTWMYPTRT